MAQVANLNKPKSQKNFPNNNVAPKTQLRSREKLFYLDTDNYGKYSYLLGPTLGLTGSALIMNLVWRRKFYGRQNKLVSHPVYGDGWFFVTVNTIQKYLFLSDKEQRTLIKKLQDLGVLETKVFGMPAYRYFRLNEEVIDSIAHSNETDYNIIEDYLEEERNSNNFGRSYQTAELELPEEQNLVLPNGRSIYKEEVLCKSINNIHTLPSQTSSPSEVGDSANAECVCDSSSRSIQKFPEPPLDNEGYIEEDYVPSRQEIISCNITSNPSPCHSKESNAKSNSSKKKSKEVEEPQKPYGDDGIVMLTQTEYNNLFAKLGKDELNHWISEVNDYCIMHGKKYESYLKAILNFKKRNEIRGDCFKKLSCKPQIREPEVNMTAARMFLAGFDKSNNWVAEACGDKIRFTPKWPGGEEKCFHYRESDCIKNSLAFMEKNNIIKINR